MPMTPDIPDALTKMELAGIYENIHLATKKVEEFIFLYARKLRENRLLHEDLEAHVYIPMGYLSFTSIKHPEYWYDIENVLYELRYPYFINEDYQNYLKEIEEKKKHEKELEPA